MTNQTDAKDAAFEALIEAAAKEVEREGCKCYEWTDAQFEVWWNQDRSCKRSQRVAETKLAVKSFLSIQAARNPGAGLVPIEQLQAIGKNIATQNNRCTDQPMFIVQQRRMITGIDTAYCEDVGWYNGDSFLTEGEEFDALELCYNKDSIEPSEWTRTGYIKIWQFVTACFTEQGCKDFLAINGHNLKEPRIYAEGSYRNEEWRTVRNALLSAAPDAPQPATSEADELLTALNLEPDTYRTDGGWLNIPKIKAAIASPENYPHIAQPAGQPTERNFCGRCGKRMSDIDSIHTCTPPAAVQPAEPLTDVQAYEIIKEATRSSATRRDGLSAYRIVRGTEAAHNINPKEVQQ